MCECSEEEFTAVASETEDGRELTVEGRCTCPQSGYQLSLAPDNPGINPQPGNVVLKLVRHAPEAGEDVLTPTPVTYKTIVGSQAQLVLIRLRNGQGELTLPITGGG
jgi:hypothetical protein